MADRIVLDGATLTPAAVARIAREGAPVELAAAARQRNDAARHAADAVLERGEELYGVTTGVGPLRGHRLDADERASHQIRLLRSHACGAGWPLRAERVRAAMATRANQLGAGGAGVAPELVDGLVAALNAGFLPFTRELGSLGTGDLTTLSDIALALLGEGQAWLGDELVDAADALRGAGIEPARLGPRDGLAFMSSNAVSVGHAALLVVDAGALLDTWLSVAALSFEAAGANPIVLDARLHAGRRQPGQMAVAERMRWQSGCASCCRACAAARASPPRPPSRTRTRSARFRRWTAQCTTR
jgi:histidine ammonia-lyase